MLQQCSGPPQPDFKPLQPSADIGKMGTAPFHEELFKYRPEQTTTPDKLGRFAISGLRPGSRVRSWSEAFLDDIKRYYHIKLSTSSPREICSDPIGREISTAVDKQFYRSIRNLRNELEKGNRMPTESELEIISEDNTAMVSREPLRVCYESLYPYVQSDPTLSLALTKAVLEKPNSDVLLVEKILEITDEQLDTDTEIVSYAKNMALLSTASSGIGAQSIRSARRLIEHYRESDPTFSQLLSMELGESIQRLLDGQSILNDPSSSTAVNERYSQLNKSGSGLYLDRSENGSSNRLVRSTKPRAFDAWMEAYLSDRWGDAGFDYVPVEPILRFKFNPDSGKTDVLAAVLRGIDLDKWITIHEGDQSFDHEQLMIEMRKIKGVLKNNIHIQHGHPHLRNFMVVPFRDADGSIDYSRQPRLYIIDFDRAYKE